MKPRRDVPQWAKTFDSHAPDGITSEGFRVVRSNGRVKFASVWWFHEALRTREGDTVFCQGQDYWQQGMDVCEAHGPMTRICRATPYCSPEEIEAERTEKARRLEAERREMERDGY